ncbi:GspE/PulE family protein [Gammaproteobacteria bacterium]|nr:GspE/PulE family protein [Gammaproteobacteria bacterium]
MLDSATSNNLTITNTTSKINNHSNFRLSKNIDESIIEFTNKIIIQAINKYSSDIHIEPYKKNYRIRYRCDGILYEKISLTNAIAKRLITRLKVISNLNINEYRTPQDGRLQLNNTNIRINTIPTLLGEKIVLRILNNSQQINIEQIGLTSKQLSIFINRITKSSGMIIVTGPTSSGKTSTVYSALKYLNNNTKNIYTIEDPIEIEIDGVNQISIQPKINLNFEDLLKAILRQDPDIIMLGEIRDNETAKTAFQISNTGHLVLTTLHTNSVAETVIRLLSLGLTKFQIINSISLIISQRLIRKLCGKCKQIKHRIYHAEGCSNCIDGYSGRIGIFELLPFTEDIIKNIIINSSTIAIKDIMKKNECNTLFDTAKEIIYEGLTTKDEINRVLTI